jgi:hyperosmotically inducible protein
MNGSTGSATHLIGCLAAGVLAIGLAGCNDRAPEMTPDASAEVTPVDPAAAARGEAMPNATESAADATLSAKVESALGAEPDLHGIAIAVRSEDGVVILSGAARDPQLRSMAAQVALSVDGVKHVRNEITLAQEA